MVKSPTEEKFVPTQDQTVRSLLDYLKHEYCDDKIGNEQYLSYLTLLCEISKDNITRSSIKFRMLEVEESIKREERAEHVDDSFHPTDGQDCPHELNGCRYEGRCEYRRAPDFSLNGTYIPTCGLKHPLKN